jgi:pyruvate/2-oxoglutarate dehydrogenase complex dihydrolipoamide dehydrogenase (E3) component
MKKYDLIWIGTGQATGTIVPRLAKAGKKVAVVENGRFGGTCVNYGCTPTKTLVASARAAHMARRGADFGIIAGEVRIDFDRVMARQNQIREQFSNGLENRLRHMDSVDIYDALATFTGPHEVRVGAEVIAGDTIVIHAGARARTVPIPGLNEVAWLDNVRLLELETLPQHLIIIGGSYIGLEFAQAFRRFGSQVTVLERGSQLMFREDADIATAAQEILEGEGITIYLNTSIKAVAPGDDRPITVFFEQKGEQHQVQGSHLLVAAGRVPNSDRLNLEAAGVETDERGYLVVNDLLQTNVPHIFALGDINGRGAFTHTSVNDGQIFWDYYSGEGDRSLAERIPIYAMFIDPPLGRIGMSEKEAQDSGRNVLMATRPMSHISRAIEKDETAGLIKILVDADSETFLGATIFGVGGDEIVNLFMPLMLAQASYKQLRQSMLIHPTVAELIPWILADLEPLSPEKPGS